MIDDYPSAYNLDSLKFAYTIVFQKSLNKSNNLLYIREAFIRDIEQDNKETYLILSTFFPKTLLKLGINQFQFEQIYKQYLDDEYMNRLCIVLNVNKLQSILTDITASESSEDSKLYLQVGSEHLYYIKGKLLSYKYLVR